MLTETQLRQILPLLPQPKAQQYLPHLNEALLAFEIGTLLRAAAFIAQTAHESAQYNRLLESLIYSKAAGLMATWPSRFPDEESALPYVRNEEKLANYVYANRMGNGDGASGDGFRYRGRGVIQLTGKDNYRAAGQALGLDLVGEPELAQTPEVAFKVAGLYWKSNKLNELADVPDFRAITQRINGGQTGAADRDKYFQTAQRVLGDGFAASPPVTRGGRSSAVIFMLPADMPPLSRGWQDQPEQDDEFAARPAAKRSAARKAGARKPGAAETASAKTAPAKKAPAKKAPSRRASSKKSAARKAPVKKLVAKKAATKKTGLKKAAPKKPAAKKATTRKPAVKRSPAKKAPAKKQGTRKPTARAAAT
jgi:putative chitinase